VDLWDLTKLLFRRWYFAAPMLLVAMVSVFVLSRSVDPDYSAEGHLQLIPAAVDDSPAAQKAAAKKVRNPWTELGYQALGLATIVKVEDESVAKELSSRNLAGGFTVNIEYGTSFYSIEAVGRTPAQATATVQYLMTILSKFVEEEQTRFGVLKEDQITTLALDKGERVTVVTSKQRRVLMVATAVGLLITASATIALDALLRRRVRLRRAAEAVEPAKGVAPDNSKIGVNGRSGVESGIPARRPVPPTVLPSDATQVIPASSGQPKGSAAHSNGESAETTKLSGGVVFRSAGAGGDGAAAERPGAVPAPNGDSAVREPVDSPDSTVVLPMARLPWTERKSR
jgi:hypothetical protein